jgi:hypothetical protein
MQPIGNKRAGSVLIAKKSGFFEQKKLPFAELNLIPILGDIPNCNFQPRQAISRLVPALWWEGAI